MTALRRLFLLVLVLPFAVSACAVAGSGPAPRSGAPEVRPAADRLGDLDFPNSGSVEAREPFLRGMLLLHSFEYEDARAAFREARRIDPDFALAAWGEALTHDHPLWSREDPDAARAALEELAPTPEERRAKAPTDREKAYLATVEILFGEGEKIDRDRAYSEALGELVSRWPEDLEARSLYALSILGTVDERDFRTYMRAAAVAEEVFAANPRHPGAAHYLIHSYDDPVHAPLGLRAARVYADIAPAATHAQHMISHIYTALGRWEEVVDANRKAVEVSEERLRRLGRPLHGRTKHSLLWLEYGLLQLGRVSEARETLEVMLADAAADPTPMQRWHAAQMRAAWIVDRPAADWAPDPVDTSEISLDGIVSDRFATGLRALVADDLDGVRKAAEEIRGASDEEASPSERKIAEILTLELEGLLAWAVDEPEEAVEILRRAAEAEAARSLEYGPPSVVQPSHELLGEVLLALERPEEALEAFDVALSRAPRRAAGMVGRVRALEALDRTADAAATRDEIEAIRRAGEPARCAPSVLLR